MNVHFYLDIFLQHLARNLPWILGGLGMTAMVGFSPLGRAIAAALRQRHRGLEVEEALSVQLADLQRTLSEVNERLDATEQRMLRQSFAPQRPGLAAGPAPAEPVTDSATPDRITTPA